MISIEHVVFCIRTLFLYQAREHLKTTVRNGRQNQPFLQSTFCYSSDRSSLQFVNCEIVTECVKIYHVRWLLSHLFLQFLAETFAVFLFLVMAHCRSSRSAMLYEVFCERIKQVQENLAQVKSINTPKLSDLGVVECADNDGDIHFS